jgi:hypothetical protein
MKLRKEETAIVSKLNSKVWRMYLTMTESRLPSVETVANENMGIAIAEILRYQPFICVCKQLWVPKQIRGKLRKPNEHRSTREEFQGATASECIFYSQRRRRNSTCDIRTCL